MSEENTQDQEYTRRLIRMQTATWKTWLDVQAPYRWNLRRLAHSGLTLEIGCGIGRNLMHLKGRAVGLDHNHYSVMACRERGLSAYTPDQFLDSPFAQGSQFDSLLLSHIAEHMTEGEVVSMLKTYIPRLKPDARILLITPQEVGYRSDASHVEFMDFGKLRAILREVGFKTERAFSFPFPRIFGHLFIYNEFVVVGSPSKDALLTV